MKDAWIKGKLNTHPCEHYVFRHNLLPIQSFQGDHGSTVTVNGSMPSTDVAHLLDCIPYPPDAVLEPLYLEAFNRFTTAFPEVISGTEFAAGFLKLKELLPSISGDVIQDIASGHLTNEFGWQNLLSDLQKLSGLFDEVQTRLKRLRESLGKPTRGSFFRANIYNAIGTQSTVTYEPRWFYVYETVDYRCDFRSGCWITQWLAHLDDAIGQFRGFVGALGLDNPVKAVWVNLPLSFVVDWFFNISAHLDRLTKARPAEEWIIEGLTHSLKCSAKIRVVQEIRSQVDPDVEIQRFPLGVVTANRYLRRNGLPLNQSLLPPIGDLTPEQLVLLLAMLSGRGRHG